MSDLEVRAALKVLNRNGLIEDVLFYTRVRGEERTIFYLPLYSCITSSGRIVKLSTDTEQLALVFPELAEAEALVRQWQLAKIAVSGY